MSGKARRSGLSSAANRLIFPDVSRLTVRSPRPTAVYLVLALGVVSFAFSPILVRFADEAPGVAIAVWRTGFSVLLLAPVALKRIGPAVRRFTRRDVALIAGAGVFLGLHFILWITSLYHTSVASASVLVTMSPLFLAVLGYLLLGERLSARTTVAIVLAVGGAVLIGWGDAAGSSPAPRPLLGNALALGAALLVSVYLLIGRVVRQRTDWLAYVFPLYAVAALTTLVVALLQQVPLFTYEPAFYGLCLLMALGPQIVGHGAFNYALQYFPAALVGMLALSEPVGASVLAYLLFDEVPGAWAVAGMVVVLIAVAGVVWFRRRGGDGKGRMGEWERG